MTDNLPPGCRGTDLPGCGADADARERAENDAEAAMLSTSKGAIANRREWWDQTIVSSDTTTDALVDQLNLALATAPGCDLRRLIDHWKACEAAAKTATGKPVPTHMTADAEAGARAAVARLAIALNDADEVMVRERTLELLEDGE